MSVPDILPPSPPTTSSRKQRMPLFSMPPTSTPDDSPASGPPSSLGSRKKVGFSPWTNILESTDAENSTDKVIVRPLPPSRDCSLSGKSILKAKGQFQSLLPVSDGPSDEKLPLNETMDSILQQLSRNDTVECVDAYQTLASAVKAYDELPEQLVLKGKLQAILKSIRQHLSALDQPDSQPCDINLVTSALKVLVIFVWNTDFAPFLNDEFRLFVLDRAINAVAEHKAPKAVIVHYLHFLATQDFRQGLITTSRAVRLLDGLAHLTDHVKGNGVVSERLLVYHRLLDQVKPVMKVKAVLWVEHMISAMVSTIPDTRSKALGLGRKACQSFPASDSIASIVKAVLGDIQDDDKTKGYAMCKKLEKMTTNKDGAEQVPQIWAIMILLSSSESVRIDKWPGLKDWLMVIQRCFNSSDSNLRLQANMAWNRFVYVARPQELEASEGLLSMLAKPIIPQLERHSADKTSKASHNAAVSSYCNLLYYAFRPATSSSRLTKAWNEYIVKVMRSSFFEKNAANADLACRILMALLWNTKTGTKVWNEKRAHETRAVDPEELPTIDAKWVRSHAGNIVNIFELLFQYSSWGLPESSEQAYISRAWRHFVKSVRNASSKEIKMSSESRTSVLAILDCIARLSHNHSSTILLATNAWHNITSTTVAELGVSYVLEACDADRSTATTTVVLAAALDQLKLKFQAPSSPSKQHIENLARCLETLDKQLKHTYAGEEIHSDAENSLLDVSINALYSIPALHINTMLGKMQAGLSLWLRDDHIRLRGPILLRLAEAFSQAAGKVGNESLGSLDDLFTAALTSSHGTVVGHMVRSWNENFSECDQTQLPPQLSGALMRLRGHIELQLPPGFADGEPADDSLPAYNTQAIENEETTSLELGTETSIVDEDRPHSKVAESIAIRPTLLAVANPQNDIPSSSRRRRHDDSQVDFVAVDSSPMMTEQESQYLTDRQKEVRARQRGEPAVVFPDLRSSPRPASRAPSESRSDCGIARRAASMVDRPSTPVPDPADDAEVQPSPTPKSRYIRNLAEVEIPSSPPSMQGGQEKLPEPEPLRETRAPIVEQAVEREDADVTMDDEGVVEETKECEDIVEETKLTGEAEHTILEAPAVMSEVDEVDEEDDVAEIHAKEKEDLPVVEHVDEEGAAEKITEHSRAETMDLPEIHQEAAIATEEHILPARREMHIAVVVPQQAAPPSTPQRGSSRIDSDELELMSASQLSNELDWSAVLDGLDQTPAFSITSIEQSADDASEASQSYLQGSQVKTRGRKRKAAGAGWTRSKKSKRSVRSSSRSTESVEPSMEYEEEILDVIEVVPRSDPVKSSSLPPREAEADVFVDAPESQQQHEHATQPKRKRGRPRKQRGVPSDVPARSLRSSSVLSSSQHERRSLYSVESSAEPGEAVRIVSVDHEGTELVAEDDQAAPTTSITESGEPVTQAAPAPELDIVASLQQILDRVKSAEPGTVDLRAVDELCFQIRLHAQPKSTLGV